MCSGLGLGSGSEFGFGFGFGSGSGSGFGLRVKGKGLPVQVGHVQQSVLEVERAALPRLQPEDAAARVAPGEG